MISFGQTEEPDPSAIAEGKDRVITLRDKVDRIVNVSLAGLVRALYRLASELWDFSLSPNKESGGSLGAFFVSNEIAP